MAEFEKAPFNKTNGSHEIVAGVRYFIDQNENKLFNSSNILKLITLLGGQDSVDQILHSQRGQVMVSFNPSVNATIPNSLLQSTGYFYELGDLSLEEAQRKLYGELYDEPIGFFEYLEDTHQGLSKAWEKGVDLISKSSKKIATYVKWGLGTVVVLSLLALLKRR